MTDLPKSSTTDEVLAPKSDPVKELQEAVAQLRERLDALEARPVMVAMTCPNCGMSQAGVLGTLTRCYNCMAGWYA